MTLNEVAAITRKEADAAVPKADAFDLFTTDLREDHDQFSGGNALRNLVRDVIRQELQGEMGARISRNLRLVVRQEVNAAIAAGLKAA
ncbi:hypothetical protein [Paracoccus albus]|uniref:hypothetical protein n=1 Tax=Paracoccus albus TaxID=3017784 RepID=UPI0022F0B931|nr:hypothetical protein [Paracoccus albus]WBU59074.1 hypothetical protein PAF20_09660 [Paracoccus albus]